MNIGLKAEPNKVAPGGRTTINISLTDANGRGVVGEELNVMSSSGSIGKLQDRGSGQYSVSLLAPDSNATSVTVVVQSASGDLRKELEVEIVGGSASTAVAAQMMYRPNPNRKRNQQLKKQRRKRNRQNQRRRRSHAKNLDRVMSVPPG